MTYVLIDKKEKNNENYENNENNENNENSLKNINVQIYLIFHVILTGVAVYLSYKCNSGYNVFHFLIAFFFPYVYIIYILAVRGMCDK